MSLPYRSAALLGDAIRRHPVMKAANVFIGQSSVYSKNVFNFYDLLVHF